MRAMSFYVFGIGLIFFNSCSSPADTAEEVVTSVPEVEYTLITNAGWLDGAWENANEYGAMRESWEVLNDSTMRATVTATTFIQPNSQDSGGMTVDTLETISLEERHGSIFYIPAVKDQNKGLPVKFRLTNSSETELKFENPEHDFPQIIRYTKVNEDSIFAVVSGNWEGKMVEEKFPFKRVK